MALQTSRGKLLKQISDLQNLKFNVAQLKLQYSGFVQFTATRIIEQEIVDEIHKKMEAAGISKKVIQTTFLSKRNVATGKGSKKSILFFITSNYVSDTGFPVAIMIERGRKSFFVKPVRRLALSWLKEGQRFFSKGHTIPAYPARKIIQTTIREKIGIVQERLDSETANWIKRILNS